MAASGYSSSYAVGMDAQGAIQPPVPQADRRRFGLPTVIFGAGCVAMFVALVLVLTGTPARMAYDPNGPGERNNYAGHDMMKMSNSIDANMKYIKEQTSSQPNMYNDLLNDINKSEKAIPQLAASIAAMGAGVKAIDASLLNVRKTTVTMRKDMEAMGKVTDNSGATMDALNGSVSGIAASMSALQAASAELTRSMDGIQTKAGSIASDGTGQALVKTKELNTALPDGVPTPQTSLDPATAGGGPEPTDVIGMPAMPEGVQ